MQTAVVRLLLLTAACALVACPRADNPSPKVASEPIQLTPEDLNVLSRIRDSLAVADAAGAATGVEIGAGTRVRYSTDQRHTQRTCSVELTPSGLGTLREVGVTSKANLVIASGKPGVLSVMPPHGTRAPVRVSFDSAGNAYELKPSREGNAAIEIDRQLSTDLLGARRMRAIQADANGKEAVVTYDLSKFERAYRYAQVLCDPEVKTALVTESREPKPQPKQEAVPAPQAPAAPESTAQAPASLPQGSISITRRDDAVSRPSRAQASATLDAEKARAFAERWFSVGEQARSADDVLHYYAAEVDYYRKGTVPKTFIASDKRAYLKRWPDRSMSVTGPVNVVARGNRAEVVIPFRYEVTSASERKTGSARVLLGIEERDGRLVIVREQQLPGSDTVAGR